MNIEEKLDQRAIDNGDYTGNSPEASFPTKALPGTEEKIKTLAARAAKGECLWHKNDGVVTNEIERRLRRRAIEIEKIDLGLDREVIIKMARNEISEELVWEKITASQ